MEQDHLKYDGRLSRLYLIWLKNLFFGIITLGIYRAWGKTNYRRYCYHSFTVAGDRLVYTGTGGELWRGMIKANIIIFFLFLAAYIPLVVVFGGDPNPDGTPTPFELLSNLLIFPVMWVMIYLAKFSALRYRLTRTKWRGIRGSQRGRLWGYIGFRFKWFFINLVTLGFLQGRSSILEYHKLLNDAYIGNKKFVYTGEVNSLDKINAITWILAIPTLFISRYWFKAAKLNAKYNNLSLGNVRLSSNFNAFELFGLTFFNILILIFTLFIGMPIVIHRIMRHFKEHVQVTGNIEEFRQDPDFKASNFGEGVTDYFDSDGIDLDFGLI